MVDNIGPSARSSLDSQGRTTIPAAIRRASGWRPGDRLHWSFDPGGFILVELVRREHSPRIDNSQLLRAKISSTAEMVRQGHLISAAEFQKLMGWSTRKAVSSSLASKRVFAIDLDSKRYFPSFFADPAYKRKHLEAVSKQLDDLPGGAKMQFFISRKGSLSGNTVLEALAAGQLELVLRIATAYAEK